jgi:hypothetical protein
MLFRKIFLCVEYLVFRTFLWHIPKYNLNLKQIVNNFTVSNPSIL